MYPESEITIAEDVKRNDVKQGEIGDCYFMATLCSLASQQPMEVENLFVTKELNKSGRYAMNLWVNGCLQVVVVDDYIPYDTVAKRPVFAGKETKNIWPILLEKAWAKVNGSYEGIVSGSSDQAMRFLIPYPIVRYRHEEELNNKDNFWKKINDAVNCKHVITCSTVDSEHKSVFKVNDKVSLVTGHAY